MNLLKKFFYKKKIIITGHTGFKGSWLTLWCVLSGAKVIGISNSEPSIPSHYKKLNIRSRIKHINLNIKNIKELKKIFKRVQPDYIFHLAAQSLVKRSFQNPLETFTTNTIGTLNILESLKTINKKCHAVLVTSDKSYKNKEIDRGYHENDVLGGHDPYSGSKGAAELIINSYYKSFFIGNKNLTISVCRAGNVIGGGDWSRNRIIPDCVKSWSKKKVVNIRNPHSTRPWQHVLEVIRGYIQSAIIVKANRSLNGQAFNFGPKNNQNKSVLQLVKEIKKHWKSVSWKIKKNKHDKKESKLLKLNSKKSKKFLKWEPILNFEQSVKMTSDWYNKYYSTNENCYNLSSNQILSYEQIIKKRIKEKKLGIFK